MASLPSHCFDNCASCDGSPDVRHDCIWYPSVFTSVCGVVDGLPVTDDFEIMV